MNLEELYREINDPFPVYQVSSRDIFLKDTIYKLAQNQVRKEAHSFDWGVYDLEEDVESQLVTEAKTLPWMSSRRWLYVRNSHLAGKELRSYLKNPSKRTVVILEIARKPKKWPRFPTIKDTKIDLNRWIEDRIKRNQFKIDRLAVQELIESIGDDRQRLTQEIDKLLLHCAGTGHINRQAVMELTQQTKDYDVFNLISCLAEGRPQKTLQILNRLFYQGMNGTKILVLLYWNFRRLLVARERLENGENYAGLIKELKIWSYRGRRNELMKTSPNRLVEILLRLREADRMCKTRNIDDKIVLEQLVVDVCCRASL